MYLYYKRVDRRKCCLVVTMFLLFLLNPDSNGFDDILPYIRKLNFLNMKYRNRRVSESFGLALLPDISFQFGFFCPRLPRAIEI